MNGRLTLGRIVLVSVLVVAPADSKAATGDLDLGFGGFGASGKIDDLGFSASAMVIDSQGRLLLAGHKDGTFHIQRRSGSRFLTVESRSITIDSGQSSAGASALAIAPDGKIVMVGTVSYPSSAFARDFAIVRLNPDLTPDETFAGGGVQTSDFNGREDDAYAVAVQEDKKVVIAGSAFIHHTLFDDIDFAVERLDENGMKDHGFADDGKWTADIQQYDTAYAVALQNDGKIVIAGDSRDRATGGEDYDFAVARLSSDGQPDGGFGDDGIRLTGFGGDEHGYGIALAPDGKVVVVGGKDHAGIALARYTSTGTPDDTFGMHGRVITDPGGTAIGRAVLVQPDGRIVVAGSNAGEIANQFVLVRYDSSGSPDETFGSGGIVLTSYAGGGGALSLALQSDGMLVAAGGNHAGRYRWDGSLDAGGIVDVVFDPQHITSIATALGVQSDGKLVAAGKVYHNSNFDMALARFTQDRSGLDPEFGTDNPKTGRTLSHNPGQDRTIAAIAVQSDDAIAIAGQIANLSQGSAAMVGRFTADGIPDGFCNADGFNALVFEYVDGSGRAFDSANSVAVLPDNRIYIAGSVRGPTDYDYGMARFKEDCTIESDGTVLDDKDYKYQSDLGDVDRLGGIVLQGEKAVLAGTSDHKIVLLRTRTDPIRLTPRLDPSFGDNGLAVLDTGFDPRVTGLGQQSDGKLIVGGWLNRSGGLSLDADFLLARFTADGMLDSTFGDGGIALADFGPFDSAYALAVRSDDTIALAGCTNAGEARLAVAQFTPSGHPDQGFSGDGKAMLRLGAESRDCAYSAAFLGRNRLVVGGSSEVFGIPEFALASVQTTDKTLGFCVGDCGGLGSVNSGDVVAMVRLAVDGNDVSACDEGDGNRDGVVTVEEIVQAVLNSKQAICTLV